MIYIYDPRIIDIFQKLKIHVHNLDYGVTLTHFVIENSKERREFDKTFDSIFRC